MLTAVTVRSERVITHGAIAGSPDGTGALTAGRASTALAFATFFTQHKVKNPAGQLQLPGWIYSVLKSVRRLI